MTTISAPHFTAEARTKTISASLATATLPASACAYQATNAAQNTTSPAMQSKTESSHLLLPIVSAALVTVLAGCSWHDPVTDDLEALRKSCGNGVCDGKENSSNCPSDCSGGGGQDASVMTDAPTSSGSPDLVVTQIDLSPSSPNVGSAVTFSATVKNQGTGATPAATIIGVLFSVDGTAAAWSDNYSQALAAGASVTLTANGGPSGPATWTATSGSHQVVAFVDDINRIPNESNESNNQLTRTFSVGTVCTPACSGKVCGPDGCGGSCGTCGAGETCSTAGQCASSPGLLGWQLNASNTGLAGAGVDRNSLPVYTGPSTPPAGTVIRLQKITTPLYLYKGNITLDRVWVQPTESSGLGSVIFTYDPSFSTAAPGPVTIMDSDIDASLVTDPKIYVDCAIRGSADVYRNNMFGMGGGICVFGSAAMPNLSIQQNYVHDLRGGYVPGMGQSHNESATIRSFTGSNLTFRNNHFISRTGSDSGALFIQAWAGPINNVLIEGNKFDTPGWDIPLESNAYGYGTNMRTRNNRFVPGGYGASYYSGGPGWAEWTDNYWYDPTQIDAKGGAIAKP